MNGIVGVWSDSDDGPQATADAMMKTLRHRGASTVVEMIQAKGAAVAIGCLSHPGTAQQIARSKTTIAALNGCFYGKPRDGAAKRLLRSMGAQPQRKVLRNIIEEDEGFSGLFAGGAGLWGFRDVSGLRPLYYAASSKMTVFASERKALWKIGFPHAKAVPTGTAIIVAAGGLTTVPMAGFRSVREQRIEFNGAAVALERLLNAATKRITKHAKKVCVAFSGGLDSGLTAVLARRVGVEPQLVSVGLTRSPELITARRYADELKMPIRLQNFDPSSMEDYIRRVLWLIEEPNLMKLSVAIPLHWAAMVAVQAGCEVMLCGQGSDELYGGYSKYARTLSVNGRKSLRAQLYRSVIDSSEVNYDRDDQATSTFPVELRTPFADSKVIEFSLGIPSEFKVKDGDDAVRKWLLRDVARRVGVPEDIVWRRKKAIQHGTGVEKAIIKLAKNRGLQPEQYLADEFEQVRRLQSMP